MHNQPQYVLISSKSSINIELSVGPSFSEKDFANLIEDVAKPIVSSYHIVNPAQ